MLVGDDVVVLDHDAKKDENNEGETVKEDAQLRWSTVVVDGVDKTKKVAHQERRESKTQNHEKIHGGCERIEMQSHDLTFE